MRTLVFILLVSSNSALTLPARAAMLVGGTAALTLPLGGEAELRCDRGSLLDCASQALTQAPLNASAQELVILGLETLIARSPGAQIAELAGLEDESRVRAAADAVGGFVCDGGRTLRRSPRLPLAPESRPPRYACTAGGAA